VIGVREKYWQAQRVENKKIQIDSLEEPLRRIEISSEGPELMIRMRLLQCGNDHQLLQSGDDRRFSRERALAHVCIWAFNPTSSESFCESHRLAAAAICVLTNPDLRIAKDLFLQHREMGKIQKQEGISTETARVWFEGFIRDLPIEPLKAWPPSVFTGRRSIVDYEVEQPGEPTAKTTELVLK